MTFTITHRGGEMEEGEVGLLPALVAELDGPLDREHPDVAVTDDATGWMLSVFQSGRVVWENPDDDAEPRHLSPISRDEALRLMTALAYGQMEVIEDEGWRPGYTGD